MKFLISFCFLMLLSCQSNKVSKDNECFVTIDGNKIHTKIIGTGPPILFAHGGYLDLDMWNPQIDAFKDSYKLIRFSDLGHGQTQRSGNDLSGHTIINELTKTSPNDKVILVGLSWGAMLSIDFALNYPEKIEKLVLVSPGLSGWDYFKDSLALRNHKLRQDAIEQNNKERAAELFHQNWVVGPSRHSKELDPEFHSKSLAMILKTMNAHWLENWSRLDTIPAIDRLDNIKLPTYIIIGDQDARDIRMIAQVYNEQIEGSELIIIKDVAHLLTLENSQQFNMVLQSILDK